MSNICQTLTHKSCNTKLLSEFINFARFPLIVLVVLVHSHFTPEGYTLPYNSYIHEYPFYCNISFLCSELIARVAVPLFFVISGYLFFMKNTESFDLNDYCYKIRTRVHSLFVPYIFWNILVFTLTLLVQIITGENGVDTILNYSICDCIRVFVDVRNGMPFCYQLWFIRDLMVIVLISPAIYFMLRNKKLAIFILLLFTTWYVVDIDNVRWYLNSQSMMFICLGSFFSIHQFDVVEKLIRVKTLSYIAALVSVAFVMISFNSCFYELNRTIRQCIYHLCVLTLMVSLTNFCLDNIAKRKWHANSFLMNSTFFIYGSHAIILGYMYAFINIVFHTKSDFFYILIYFIIPIVVVAIGLWGFAVMKKRFPKLTGMITGGRL